MSIFDKPRPTGYRTTLRSLQEEGHALRLRLLLAIRTGDTAVQAQLEQEIQENERLIGQMVPTGSLSSAPSWGRVDWNTDLATRG